MSTMFGAMVTFFVELFYANMHHSEKKLLFDQMMEVFYKQSCEN